MTRIAALASSRRRMTPSATSPGTIFGLERSTPPVPHEFLSLYAYLERRYATSVVLTFEQMEALLGFALPEAAQTESHWWTGTAVRPQAYSAAWIVAGRTATPNMGARTVTFVRP